MQVVWSEPALADLTDTRRHIARENPGAASRIAVALVAAADKLEHFPMGARAGDEPGTRELATIYPYLIVYRIDDDRVQILRVWHGAQRRR